MRRLVRDHKSVDMKNEEGCTPLMYAVLSNSSTQAGIMEVLLEKRAAVDACDAEGMTALSLAAALDISAGGATGGKGALALLLERGANLNGPDELGCTPLMYAAASHKGGVAALQQLLAHGAHVNHADNDGDTALFDVIANKPETIMPSCLKLLLDAGADIDHVNKSGETALFLASAQGNTVAAKFLIEAGAGGVAKYSSGCHGPNRKSALCATASSGSESTVGLLLAHGADPNHRGDTGRTPLFWASQKGRTMVVRILLEHQADPHARDDNDQTAICLAQEFGRSEIVRLLSRVSATYTNAPAVGQTLSDIYQYSPLLKNSSIRLVELCPGEPTDVLCLRIHDVLLQDSPIYEALSYEWGERSGSMPVQCEGGQHLLITPNLKYAFHHLRLWDKTRTLWIDAICINQDDMLERNQQVSMMGRIFREASSVIIAIGKASQDTRVGMRTAAVFSRTWETLCRRPGWSLNSAYDNLNDDTRDILTSMLRKLSRGPDDGRKNAASLSNLFLRPYFTHAWILREVLFAGDNGVVVCGSQQCPWSTLQKTLWVMNLIVHCWHRGRDGWHFVFGGEIHKMLAENSAFRSPFGRFGPGIGINLSAVRVRSGVWHLNSALACMAPFSTTDPRDKVYAALEFVPNYSKKGLLPDYGLTVQEVYTKAARHFVAKAVAGSAVDTGSFVDDSLSRPMDKTITGLPSWVPDWTITPQRRRLRIKYKGNFSRLCRARRLAGARSVTTTETSLFTYGCFFRQGCLKVHVTLRL